MARISRSHLYMRMAELMALRGSCKRAQVGCVITLDNRIISTGYNGPPTNEPPCSEHTCDLSKSCTRAIHAEANAIAHAAKFGLPLNGAVLYCSYSPCPTCSRLIAQAGIKEVYYLTPYKDPAGIEILKNNLIKCLQITDL